MSEQMWLLIAAPVGAGVFATIAGLYFANRERREAEREREQQARRS